MRTGIERIILPSEILRVTSPNGESKVIVEGLEGQTRLGNIDEEYSRRFLYVSLDGQKGFVPFANMIFRGVDSYVLNGKVHRNNAPYKIAQFGSVFEDETDRYLNLTPAHGKEKFRRVLIEGINDREIDVRVNNKKLYDYRKSLLRGHSAVDFTLEAIGEWVNGDRKSV